MKSRPYIDIRVLNKKGMLFPGASCQLTWKTEHDEGYTTIDCRAKKDRLVIEYKYDGINGDERMFQHVIDFDFTPCHFGGRRTWFLCPTCGKRVAVVYKFQWGYSCRHCCDLTYLSRSENKVNRLMQKAKMNRVRVGGTGDVICSFPPKPKGMHWRTYWRLYKLELELLQPTWDRVKKQYGL